MKGYKLQLQAKLDNALHFFEFDKVDDVSIDDSSNLTTHTMANGDVFTVVEPACFQVLPEVTYE